jgi:hypothetical protein
MKAASKQASEKHIDGRKTHQSAANEEQAKNARRSISSWPAA